MAYMMRGNGMNISVDSVLERMNAEDQCGGVGDMANLYRAGGTWQDDLGRDFAVGVRRLPDLVRSGRKAEDYLPILSGLARQPLILLMPGNSVVLTRMVLDESPMIWVRPGEVTLRDPWTGSPNLRVLHASDLPERLGVMGLAIRRI